MDNEKKKITKRVGVIFSVLLVLIIVVLLILKYQVEGEQNMPFNLGKIIVISTAEGVSEENPEVTWDLNIVQNNDIYIKIDKNKNYKETEIISKITLDNFNVTKSPKKGKVVIYRPSISENKTYERLEEYKVKDKIEYIGSSESNIKNLQIANQGGVLLLRLSIEDLGKYTSQDDTEIRHDGTLLSKIEVTKEEIISQVTFDLTITLTSGISYKGTVTVNIPSGNIQDEGTSSREITNFKDVIFKRT